MFGSFDGSRTSSYVAEKNHISFQQTCSVQKSSTVALPVVFRSSEKFYCLQSVQKSRSIFILSDRCESNRNQHGAPHRSCGSLTRMPWPATGKKSPGEVSAGVSIQRARRPGAEKQFRDCSHSPRRQPVLSNSGSSGSWTGCEAPIVAPRPPSARRPPDPCSPTPPIGARAHPWAQEPRPTYWAFKPRRRSGSHPPLESCRLLPIRRPARPQGWTVNEIPSPPGRGTRPRPSPRRGHRRLPAVGARRGLEGAVAFWPGRFVRKTFLPAGVPGRHRARTDGVPRINAPRRAAHLPAPRRRRATGTRSGHRSRGDLFLGSITCSGGSSLGG